MKRLLPLFILPLISLAAHAQIIQPAPSLSGANTFTGSISVANNGTFISSATNSYVTALLNGCNPQTEFFSVQFQNGLTSGVTGCVTGPAAGSGVYQINGVSGFATTNDANAVGGYFQARPLANNSHAWGINSVCQTATGLTTGVICNSAETDVQFSNATDSGTGNLIAMYTPGGFLGTYNAQGVRVLSNRPGTYFAQAFRVDRSALDNNGSVVYAYPWGTATGSQNYGGPNILRALLSWWDGAAAHDEDFDFRPEIPSGSNPAWDGMHWYHNGGPGGQKHHIYVDPTMDFAIAHNDGSFSTISAATTGNGADQVFTLPVVAGAATLAVQGNPATNVFYAQPSDTIASIEAECSSACDYIVAIPQTFTLAANHTLSSNVNVIGFPSGSWTVNGGGFTLTFGAPFSESTPSSPTPFFSGTAAIGGLVDVYPEWFGSISSATTLPAAVAACTTGPCTLHLGIARYNTSSWNNTTPLAANNLTIAGTAMPFPNSTSTPTAMGPGSVLYPSFTASGSYLNIHDVGCDNGSATTGAAADCFNLLSFNNAVAAAAPGTVTPTPSTTGGTLAANTYYYKVTATNAQGETNGSPEASATTTGSTGSVALAWAAVTNATGYKIYRGTGPGLESVFFTSATNSYTDTNASSTAGIPILGNTTGATGKDLTLRNISCLGNSVGALFHCMKVEGYDMVTGDNLWGWRNSHGLAIKTTHGSFSNIHEQGHSLSCVIAKSNIYAPMTNTAISNETCRPEVAGDTSAALQIQGQAQPIVAISASNITAFGAQYGINLQGDTTAAGAVNGASVMGASFSGLTSLGINFGGFMSNVTLSGLSFTNGGSWTSITAASDPNISSLVISNSVADAQTGVGCINLPNKASLYNSPTLTNSTCNTVPQPSPSSLWTVGMGQTITAGLVQNGVIPGTSFVFDTPIKVIGIDLLETNTGACTTQPVLYVYDTTANQRANGTQVIFANGTTTYHNTGAPVVVAAGDTVALEAQANATCTTTPTFVAVVRYQAQ